MRRELPPTGVYAANLIDFRLLGLSRAELATLRRIFRHVALTSEPSTLAGDGGGNLVAIAQNSPVDLSDVERGLRCQRLARDVISGDQLTTWIDGAMVLTDTYAPVDQLLTPHA